MMHKLKRPILASLLFACRAAPELAPQSTPTEPTLSAPTDTTTTPPTTVPTEPGPGWIEGLEADEGFGSAVAISGDDAWIGAPHGSTGRVYTISAGKPVVLAEGSGRFGSALSCLDGEVIIGAPLAGEDEPAVLTSTGEVLLTGGDTTGLALSADQTWVAATGSGWIRGDGSSGTAPSRPTAIAIDQDRVAVGMALGDIALAIGETHRDREAPLDQAGFSLAVGDVDGDGISEWVVGAPGVGRVYLYQVETHELIATLSGSGGRFGAAVAVHDIDADGFEDILVGSPMEGAETEGAVRLYSGADLSTESRLWQGEEAGGQLGFSVAATDDTVLLGAPGAAGSPGRVWLGTP